MIVSIQVLPLYEPEITFHVDQTHLCNITRLDYLRKVLLQSFALTATLPLSAISLAGALYLKCHIVHTVRWCVCVFYGLGLLTQDWGMADKLSLRLQTLNHPPASGIATFTLPVS